MKVAVVGTGIAGNVAAYHLHRSGEHDLTVYEAAGHVGGHTHTHDVRLDGDERTWRVDTGFIVFNDRTYPHFEQLLDSLRVPSQPSTMSFSVTDEPSGVEYQGSSVDGLFARRSNALRPSHWRMLAEIVRFNREAPALLEGKAFAADGAEAPDLPLGAYLEAGKYSRAFIDRYVIPMGAAIWSTDPARMLGFPARFFVRFLHHHGMLALRGRPQWRVIQGGSASYVERLTAPFRDRIRVRMPVEWIRRSGGGVFLKARDAEVERFDAVFIACHSDQALALLADPSPAEREVLGAIPYQRNEAVLHTDVRALPRRRRAWAAWNYRVRAEPGAPVSLTYDMNTLQSLDAPERFLVTLNAGDAIDPARVIARLSYDHPLFTPAGVAAQARQAEVNGPLGTYYCGAWWRNGFHEDGVVSALRALGHFAATTARARIHAHAERALPRAG
jgi:predicted NAD/FAD-binding protein